jgi:uncharacterized cupin superfamily protein
VSSRRCTYRPTRQSRWYGWEEEEVVVVVEGEVLLVRDAVASILP